MRIKLTATATTLSLSAVLLLGGCKSSPAPAPAAQPASQGAVAPGQTAPEPQPLPPAPTQAATAPAATPAAAPASAPVAPPPVTESSVRPEPVAPRVLTAPAGSRVAVTLTETLRASTANVGDGFTGVLAQPLAAPGGGVVFPRGTRVAGSVVAAKGRGRFKGAGALGIQLTSIGGARVTSSEYEKEEKGKGKRTGALIGGGGGLGAIIGGIAGGGKGALIGGLAGAGAGTAGAAYTGNHDVVIPSESLITFRLENSVSR
jgi:hypothetical protein